MEIIEGIHRVDSASSNMAHSNVYLYFNGNELAVIDTGTPGNAEKIVEYIQKIGHQSSEVTSIVLTHYHMDHAGSAKALKDLLPNAKVAAHQEDADYISGKQSPKSKSMFLRAASAFIKVTPVPVEVILNDGDKIGSLLVIHVPGHTPGSIALLDTQKGVLFVGDTLRSDGKKVTGAPENLSWDRNKLRESVGKLAGLQFEVLLPGHGNPLEPDASDAVKRFYEANK